MWDPKRLSEDRTPPAAEAAPRPPDSIVGHVTCSEDAVCPKCLDAVRVGDQATHLVPVDLEQSSQVWHRRCWVQTYPRFADSEFFSLNL